MLQSTGLQATGHNLVLNNSNKISIPILFHSKLLQDIEYSPVCKTSVSLEETYEIFWYSNTQD